MHDDQLTFSLRDVSFGIGDQTILQPLTLDLSLKGQVAGLIGHNGSGKSTLLKLLARQLSPLDGAIQLNGEPLEKLKDRALARQLAYLPQNPPPAAGMTVRNLVALGRYPWHGALGRFSRADRDAVDEAMTLTRVTAMADRLVDTLSGGERQRAWLAMLVAQKPQCLLLDEPISALDIAYQIEILKLVGDLARNHDLGVIVVLHDINMAARFCDDIIALHSGRLLVRGTPDEILQPEILQSIYGIEMRVTTLPGAAWPIATHV
ncbi:ABC transporter ATP-binding protein [Martelella endophytica]|uniref:Iron-hydroxamate transporter ATP-binding subunit n=1 Tax=Martelella endophytica TaxID=1486262 RepID=A0A0D5LMX1_MAREN|nr:ATP-binding cassette domain-containing protein [Martelella endophytica]AJY45559.1 iron-hydroxamate transporter ATP-binding subunit [Martelella endophytica]